MGKNRGGSGGKMIFVEKKCKTEGEKSVSFGRVNGTVRGDVWNAP